MQNKILRLTFVHLKLQLFGRFIVQMYFLEIVLFVYTRNTLKNACLKLKKSLLDCKSFFNVHLANSSIKKCEQLIKL